MSDELVGWVGLCLVPRIGGRRMSALLKRLGSPRAVFDAPEAALLQVPQIGPATVDAIREIDLSRVRDQIAKWRSEDITLLTWQDNAYPQPFLDLPDRPPLLFARGNLKQSWKYTVAIVGTRSPTPPMARLARRMGYELSRRGWLVVSGLARGIDAAVHRGAVDGGGRTAAFLGSGVDIVYPSRNHKLGQDMLERGAIYAEVPPGSTPTAGALMARNRLIAGAAKAVLVVQAGLESGSMEAARRAWNQHRHVLAVDVPEFEGNQELLRLDGISVSPQLSDWDAFAEQLKALPAPPRQLSLFEVSKDTPSPPSQLDLFE